jgi:hypothetical protein
LETSTALVTQSKTNVYYEMGTVGWGPSFGGLNTVVLGPPTITQPLSNIVANAGETVIFNVSAKSPVPATLTYQWQRNGVVIAGANNSSLTLSNLQQVNTGNYTVVVSNDYGSVTSTAALTFSLAYTQAQYETAIQLGYDLGMQSGGGSDVLTNPNSYDLYTLDQVQALNVGTPLLARDAVSKKFKLTVKAKKSKDLKTYTDLPFSAGDAVINGNGEMEFQFASPDNAAFFRIESR